MESNYTLLPVHSQVLYEDNHIIILAKKAGQIVHGDKTGDKSLEQEVKDYLKCKYNKPGNVFCGVVHRLDRPVSGVVMFAKTGKSLQRLNAMIKAHQIQKTYWAVVSNRPAKDRDTLCNYLVRNEKQNKSYIVKPSEQAKYAELDYALLGQSNNYFLLQIALKTGRHHQIRVQLSAIGCPIKGDLKYGAKRSNPDGSIALHARELKFVHPVNKQSLVITAPVPDEPLWQYFETTTENQTHKS